jgi:putative chitobiose transport system substrate-binding protein
MRVKSWVSRIALSVVLVLLLGVLAGCGIPKNDADNPKKSDGPITLEFWTINLKKDFSDYIQGLIQSYEKAHPNVKIKWVDVPGQEVDRKLLAALAAGEAPDVVNLDSMNLPKFVDQDALAPVDGLLQPNDLNVYFANLRQGLTFNGKLMAVPWYHAGPYIGMINTDLYKKAGLDPNKPPANLDEALQHGKLIHQKLSNVYGSNTFPNIMLMVAEGLPILSPDKKKAVFNSPQHVQFVQKFVDAYKTGAISSGVIGKEERSLPQNLENEQVAIATMQGAFNLTKIEKNAPNVFQKIKVTPPMKGKAGIIPLKGIQTLVVPKASAHPKEAADFAKFVTSPENQLAFCKLVPIFPSTEQTLKDPFFTQFEVKTKQDEARKIMVSSMKEVVSDTLGIQNEQDLRDAFDEEMRAVLMGKKSVKQGLDDAVKKWNESLAQSQ